MLIRICSLAITIALLSACSQSPQIVSSSESPKLKTSSPTINTQISTKINYPIDITQFKNIDSANLKTDFNTETVSSTNNSSRFIRGNYDLNSDSKNDKILFQFNSSQGSPDASLTINNQKLSFLSDAPGTAKIVDLDSSDSYKEIALFDDGPSADPHYKFFRYTGNQILQLGEIHETVLINGMGKVITTWESFPYDKNFPFAIYKIQNNSLTRFSTDFKSLLNKEFIIPDDMDGYFQESLKIPNKDYSPNFADAPNAKFKKGERFKLIQLKLDGGHPYWYYIERANGKRGVMYFWIGD